MSSSTPDIRKMRGRPKDPNPKGRDFGILVRVPQNLLDAIDAYQNENGLKSRPEAIRRILSEALDLE